MQDQKILCRQKGRKRSGLRESRTVWYKECGDPHTDGRGALKAIPCKRHSGRGRAQKRPQHHTPQAGGSQPNPDKARPEGRKKRSKVRGSHTDGLGNEEGPGQRVSVTRA